MLAARARYGNYSSSVSVERDSRAWDRLHGNTPATRRPSEKTGAGQQGFFRGKRLQQRSTEISKMHDSPSSSLDEFRPHSLHQRNILSKGAGHPIHQIQTDIASSIKGSTATTLKRRMALQGNSSRELAGIFGKAKHGLRTSISLLQDHSKKRKHGDLFANQARLTSAPNALQKGHANVNSVGGLKNLGNTCYLNSVLQAILGLTSFMNDLKSQRWQQLILACAESAIKKAGMQILDRTTGQMVKSLGSSAVLPKVELAPQILRLGYLMQRTKSSIADIPRCIKRTVAKHSSRFYGHAQEDAHEFFLDLVNILHNELFSLRTFLFQGERGNYQGKVLSSDCSEDALSSANAAVTTLFSLDKETEAGECETSSESEERRGFEMLPTTRNLHAEIEVKFCCTNCKMTHHVTELYRDISVDIPVIDTSEDNSVGVSQLLRSFFSPEIRELRCEECKCNRFKVSYRFHVLPRVLVIHLKRFQVDFSRQQYIKVHTPVILEPSLNVSEFCTQGAKNAPDHDLGPVGDQAEGIRRFQAISSQQRKTVESGKSDSEKTHHSCQNSPCSKDVTSPPTPIMKPASSQSPKDRNSLMKSSPAALGQTTPRPHLDPQKALARQIARKKRRRNIALSKEERAVAKQMQTEKLFGKSPVLSDKSPLGATTKSTFQDLLTEDERNLARVLEISRREEEERVERAKNDSQKIVDLSMPESPLSKKVDARRDIDNMQTARVNEYMSNPGSSIVQPVKVEQARDETAPDGEQDNGRRLDSTGDTNSTTMFITESNSSHNPQYDLKCVVRHIGRAAFAGHYNTDVCTQKVEKAGLKQDSLNLESKSLIQERVWSRFDDSSVSKDLSQETVLDGEKNQRAAYLLFYVQRDC